MASNLEKIEQETITNSLEIVHQKVRLLMEVWKMFFDEIRYLDYLTSLPNSIDQFLSEIYGLTMAFCVRKTYQIREQKMELLELRRVLGMSVDDVDDDFQLENLMLDHKLAQRKERISALRREIDDRKRLMEQYTIDETMLLKDLGEPAPPHEPLCPHPETGLLPDADKMAQFGDYISRLRAEKVKRIATRDRLQADIRMKAQMLNWVPKKDRHRELINEQTLIPSLSNLSELQHLDFVLSGLLERKRQHGTEGKKPSQPQSDTQSMQPPQKEPPGKEPEEPEEPGQSSKDQPDVPKPQQPQSGTPITQTPPPPPPPPSPASEMDAICKMFSSSTFVYQCTVEAYIRKGGLCNTPANRKCAIEKLFQHVRDSIYTWWERCLISPNERTQCKVLYTKQLDKDAFGAHVEQQKLLKSYFHENEAIFTHIYTWAEMWNRCLQLQKQAEKTDQQGEKEKAELSETIANLARHEEHLEAKCRDFEQRCQVKFTMYGMSVMEVLHRCREKQEELKLPASCSQAAIANDNSAIYDFDLANALKYVENAANAFKPLNIVPSPNDRVTSEEIYAVMAHKIYCVLNKYAMNGNANHVAADVMLGTCAAKSAPQEPKLQPLPSDDSDDSNHGDSSSGGEADEQRDDELLEEAFASATAVSTKKRVQRVNGHPAS